MLLSIDSWIFQYETDSSSASQLLWSPLWELCSAAPGKAVSCSNGVRAFLQRYSRTGASSWADTLGAEGVKPTYSLNAFMPFHWGSCLFTVVKEADLFSCSAFLFFPFTGKFFLFYFAILLISLSQLKLLVCDSIFYTLSCFVHF